MDFSEKLVTARKAKGFSQEALAEKTGVSRQAVSKWETGEAKPDLDKLIALCRVLELSMDALCLDREAVCPPVSEKKRRVWPWVILAVIVGLLVGTFLTILVYGMVTDVDSGSGTVFVADADLSGGGDTLTVSLTLSREVANMQVRIFAVDPFTGDRKELTALSADGNYQAEYVCGSVYDVKFLAEVTLNGEKVNLPLFRVKGEGLTFTFEELWR